MSLIKREQFEDNLKQEALINKSFVPIFRLREQEHYYILTADYITYTQEYKVFGCKAGLYVCTTPIIQASQIQQIKPAPSIPPRWDIL